MAANIMHDKMKVFIKRLKTFAYGILNHCDYPIGTGLLEGMNNKIKLIKRRAYGFHDQEYFALKLKQAFPGHPTTNFLG
jgi:transposase